MPGPFAAALLGRRTPTPTPWVPSSGMDAAVDGPPATARLAYTAACPCGYWPATWHVASTEAQDEFGRYTQGCRVLSIDCPNHA